MTKEVSAEDIARARVKRLTVVRFSGVGLTMIGMAAIAGKIALPLPRLRHWLLGLWATPLSWLRCSLVTALAAAVALLVIPLVLTLLPTLWTRCWSLSPVLPHCRLVSLSVAALCWSFCLRRPLPTVSAVA